MMIGPIGNVILGALVYFNSHNLSLILVCRCLKQVMTTFSNTVIAMACMADFLSGKELSVALAKFAATYGMSIFAMGMTGQF